MKSIFHKLEFHYTYLIMAFGLVITGHFANLLIFTSLIIVHECGHFIMAKIFRYKVDKIIIYPYGGITKLDTMVNTKIWQDLIVALGGVVFQLIYYFIIIFLYNNGFIRQYIYSLFYLYNKSMIFFNLLPIYPLDGSKIVGLLFCKYFKFNLANILVIVTSFFTIIILLISKEYENNYSYLMAILVLLQNIYKFYFSLDAIYNRFLVERYLYNFNYKRKKIIDSRHKMYKNKYHYFITRDGIVDEKKYLNSFFRKNK